MKIQKSPQKGLNGPIDRIISLNKALAMGQITKEEYDDQVMGLFDAEAAKKLILPERGRM